MQILYPFFQKKQKNIYLDTAAATPVQEQVLQNFIQYSKDCFANPHTFHDLGKKSGDLVEVSRAEIARSLGIQTREIYFTSGGTEGDNLALLGTVSAAQKRGIKKPHIIVSAIEHPAIREPAQILAEKGIIDLSVIPVSGDGVVDARNIKKAITVDTVLVSVMLVNNEIGTRQMIEEIAKMIRHVRKNTGIEYPYLHTDAVQGFYEDLYIPKLGVDMLTLTSGKMYGVRGIGLLYKKESVVIEPILWGGDQEQGLRSGTVSAPLVAAFKDALLWRKSIYKSKREELKILRQWFLCEIEKRFSVYIHAKNAGASVSPHIVNVTFFGIPAEHLVVYLASKGVFVSSKSACSANTDEVSHVLSALYEDTKEGIPFMVDEGSVRFSFSVDTTKKDLEYVLSVMEKYVQVQGKLVKAKDSKYSKTIKNML